MHPSVLLVSLRQALQVSVQQRLTPDMVVTQRKQEQAGCDTHMLILLASLLHVLQQCHIVRN
eukprot:1136635-Pelagomonas_calceolata.AAC.2